MTTIRKAATDLTTTWEFHEVDAYRLDQGEKP